MAPTAAPIGAAACAIPNHNGDNKKLFLNNGYATDVTYKSKPSTNKPNAQTTHIRINKFFVMSISYQHNHATIRILSKKPGKKIMKKIKVVEKTFLFFVFLFLISCLGQMSSDVYLPALPTIRNAFDTTENWMQCSLAIYMLGFSLSHLIYGPISDDVGRKKPLVIGIGICIIGTLCCRFSTGIELLIIGRLLQGIGAGAGAALFLSILRDVYHGNQLAKISSFLAISRVILLACSPLIGGYLMHFFEWQACFTFLLIYAGICFIASAFIFKESNPYAHLEKTTFLRMAKNINMLLSHRIFMGYAFCVMLAFGGILAWLTTLPFLLQDIVGLSPIEFGWVSALSGLFFIFANAYAGAMHPFSEMAGTAAAVFGFLQILGGAISSFLMSTIKNYNQIPLGIILLLSAICAFITVKVTAKK